MSAYQEVSQQDQDLKQEPQQELTFFEKVKLIALGIWYFVEAFYLITPLISYYLFKEECKGIPMLPNTILVLGFSQIILSISDHLLWEKMSYKFLIMIRLIHMAICFFADFLVRNYLWNWTNSNCNQYFILIAGMPYYAIQVFIIIITLFGIFVALYTYYKMKRMINGK